MSEDESKNGQAAQKLIADGKQTTVLRKIAVQSLSPMMIKLEQHIAFILEETKQLRKNNLRLEEAMGTHRQMQQQMKLMNAKLIQMNATLLKLDSEKESRIVSSQLDIKQLHYQVNRLKEQAGNRDAEMQKIKGDWESSMAHMDKNKAVLSGNINQLKTQLNGYYERQIKQMEQLRHEDNSLWSKIHIMQQVRVAERTQFESVAKLVGLYESERGGIRQTFERAVEMMNKVVTLDLYERDRRIGRADSELLKQSVRKMLDEALTPQIRKYLPVLMQKMEAFKDMQLKMEMIEGGLLEHTRQFKENAVRADQVKQQLKQHAEALVDTLESTLQQQINAIKDQLLVFRSRFNDGDIQLQREIEKCLRILRDQMERRESSFVSLHKESIYDCVKQMQPVSEKEEEVKIKEIVYSVEPLIEEVKDSIGQCKDQFNGSKLSLQEKLMLFSNQIVRVKSDVKIELAQFRKVIESHGNRLGDTNLNCADISRMTAKCIEILMMLVAVGMQSSKDVEVYVTYNDGIIYELGGAHTQAEMAYRKKIVNKDIFKKAVMAELIKVVDFTIINQPMMRWGEKEFKPSHFFADIITTYIKFAQERRGRSSERQNIDRNNSTHDQDDYLKPKNRKQGSMSKTISKTIDIQENDRYGRSDQMEQIEQSSKRNIRLRKIDQRSKNEQ